MDQVRRYYVYAYLRAQDSDNGKAGTPYYVGKGKGKRAFTHHRDCAANTPTSTHRIIFLGVNLTERQAFDAEKHFIRYYGRVDLGTGCLRNKSDGGQGGAGWVPTKEFVANLVKFHTGRKRTEATRQRIRDSHVGFQGRKHSDTTRGKISSGNKGKQFSQEHRKHIGEASKGRNAWNKGYRLKDVIPGYVHPNQGKPLSEATRRKISEARKAYYQRRKQATHND